MIGRRDKHLLKCAEVPKDNLIMLDKIQIAWQTAAGQLDIERCAFINGRDKSMQAFYDYTDLKPTRIEFN